MTDRYFLQCFSLLMTNTNNKKKIKNGITRILVVKYKLYIALYPLVSYSNQLIEIYRL